MPVQAPPSPSLTAVSLFDERIQPSERLIPLPGNHFKISAGFPKALLLQLPHAFAPAPPAVHDTGSLEHAQVIRDRLARHAIRK